MRFLSLPLVLKLHLNRLKYDFYRNAMVKINECYELDIEIDLSPFVDNSDECHECILDSVLVHVGDVNEGHYHAFIGTSKHDKPEPGEELSRWLKFDDKHVSIVEKKTR